MYKMFITRFWIPSFTWTSLSLPEKDTIGVMLFESTLHELKSDKGTWKKKHSISDKHSIFVSPGTIIAQF